VRETQLFGTLCKEVQGNELKGGGRGRGERGNFSQVEVAGHLIPASNLDDCYGSTPLTV